MGKIQLLDIEVANLIAAGEVVDRPSSVVKELLENAIDAGASAVTLEIRAGGIGMIRVTDNGCGMSEEDLPTAIKRHATSKIRSADDLARIGTLGFRGEALAAIAAVSDMHIISKRKEDEYGHVLTASDGRILGIEEVGCADGTVMLIENLFARIPARRKFLKKDTTEAQSIAAVAEKIAMSHPEIAFTFINQDQVKFKTQGDGVLLHTLHALLGKDVSSRLIAIEGGSLGVRVHGFVGRSDAVRGNRNAQNFFLNGRYIKSRTVMAALERAFVSYVAPEKFPIAAIFITVDPSAVDVNVHPTKLEIKFSDEKLIFESVYYAVRAALEENTSRPALTFKESRAQNQVSPRAEAEEKAGNTPSLPKTLRAEPTAKPSTLSPDESLRILDLAKQFRAMEESPVRVSPIQTVSAPTSDLPRQEKTRLEHASKEVSPFMSSDQKEEAKITTAAPSVQAKEDEILPPTESEKEASLPSYRIVGTLFRCYIILELGENQSECLIIDQHAAHERILFEDLKKKRATACASQALLVPLSVRLTPEEFGVACEHREVFASVGFEFHEGSGNTVILTAIPNAISPRDAESLTVSMAAELAEGTGNPALTADIRAERALYQVACKAAIKGGRTYDDADIDWLCRQVLAMPDVTVCPHGRPIAFTLKKSELDRRFNRI